MNIFYYLYKIARDLVKDWRTKHFCPVETDCDTIVREAECHFKEQTKVNKLELKT